MDDHPPTRAHAIAGLARETILFVLAFTAGFGTYMQAVSSDPIRMQDWFGAMAAGAGMCILKMFPTGSTRRNRG